MTNTKKDTLLGTISAVNEALIAHEADAEYLNGSLMDVVETVEAFADYANEHAREIVDKLDVVNATMEVLGTIIVANGTAKAYRDAVKTGGITFAYQSAQLLKTATAMTSAIMNHIEELA